ncbi:hypothetical protein ADUPG1_009009 [Aduncisulcus paluster]|uniref:Uncharacterized protein n=1 Tax=Aduncisulcus paluster TaxID=2918883 RepID=A0ABQ5KU16_9EUKA|nr:hypothetical protein ADUPG1_009009 [Aduncisulcus paluster]
MGETTYKVIGIVSIILSFCICVTGFILILHGVSGPYFDAMENYYFDSIDNSKYPSFDPSTVEAQLTNLRLNLAMKYYEYPDDVTLPFISFYGSQSAQDNDTEDLCDTYKIMQQKEFASSCEYVMSDVDAKHFKKKYGFIPSDGVYSLQSMSDINSFGFPNAATIPWDVTPDLLVSYSDCSTLPCVSEGNRTIGSYTAVDEESYLSQKKCDKRDGYICDEESSHYLGNSACITISYPDTIVATYSYTNSKVGAPLGAVINGVYTIGSSFTDSSHTQSHSSGTCGDQAAFPATNTQFYLYHENSICTHYLDQYPKGFGNDPTTPLVWGIVIFVIGACICVVGLLVSIQGQKKLRELAMPLNETADFGEHMSLYSPGAPDIGSAPEAINTEW